MVWLAVALLATSALAGARGAGCLSGSAPCVTADEVLQELRDPPYDPAAGDANLTKLMVAVGGMDSEEFAKVLRSLVSRYGTDRVLGSRPDYHAWQFFGSGAGDVPALQMALALARDPSTRRELEKRMRSATSGATLLEDFLADPGVLASYVRRTGGFSYKGDAPVWDDPVVQAFEDDPALVDAADDQGRTLVSILLTSDAVSAKLRSQGDRRLLLEDLLARGATPTIADREGRTPLHHAVLTGSSELVDLALDLGVDASVADVNGALALDLAPPAMLDTPAGQRLAAASRDALAAREAERAKGERDAAVFAVRSDPHELFTIAAYGTANALQALKDAGLLRFDARDPFGQSPLMYAVANNSAGAVRELLRLGADVGAVADAGWTPLMYATRNETPDARDVLASLVLAGADLGATNHDGDDAADVAQIEGHDDAAAYLRDLAGRPDPRVGALLTLVRPGPVPAGCTAAADVAAARLGVPVDAVVVVGGLELAQFGGGPTRVVVGDPVAVAGLQMLQLASGMEAAGLTVERSEPADVGRASFPTVLVGRSTDRSYPVVTFVRADVDHWSAAQQIAICSSKTVAPGRQR